MFERIDRWTKPTSRAATITRRRRSSSTDSAPFITRDTVPKETPARRATAVIEATLTGEPFSFFETLIVFFCMFQTQVVIKSYQGATRKATN